MTLSAFCIDVDEVTVGPYRACVDPGLGPPDPDDRPVTDVDWSDAQTYCLWAGKRLPTDAEWEKAARGGCEVVPPDACGAEDERTWPWGDDAPACDRANLAGCGGAAGAAGARPDGAGPYGVHDLCGNAAGWVADWYDWDYSGCPEPCVDPRGPGDGISRVVRGGSFFDAAADARAATRDLLLPELFDEWTGFRCAADP